MGSVSADHLNLQLAQHNGLILLDQRQHSLTVRCRSEQLSGHLKWGTKSSSAEQPTLHFESAWGKLWGTNNKGHERPLFTCIIGGNGVRTDSVLVSSLKTLKPSIYAGLVLFIVHHGSLREVKIQHLNVHRNVGLLWRD